MDEGGINRMEGPHSHVAKVKRRNKGAEATFDINAHKEWVTGYRKRKQQRRKAAAIQQVQKDHQRSLNDRKQKREERKAALADQLKRIVQGGGGDKEGEEGEDSEDSEEDEDDEEEGEEGGEPEQRPRKRSKKERKEVEHLEEHEGVVEYGNGTSVMIEALVPEEEENPQALLRPKQQPTTQGHSRDEPTKGELRTKKIQQASMQNRAKKLLASFGAKKGGKSGKLKSSKAAKAERKAGGKGATKGGKGKK